MKYEIFSEVGSRDTNTISINRSDGFGFNSGFYRKKGINSYSFVTLLFSKENEKISIGFKFTKETGPGSLKITHKGSTGAIVSHSFFKRYSIKSEDYAGHYEVQDGFQEGVGQFFFIYLKAKDDNGSKSQ